MNNGLAQEWAETFFGGIPGRLPELEAAMKNSAALNEKLAAAAFGAAEDSIKLSAEWTKETLADLEQVAKTEPEPAKLATTLTQYTTDAAGKSTQKMTAFAEIMGRMQAETIRLFVEASRATMDAKADAADVTPVETDKPKVKKAAAAA